MNVLVIDLGLGNIRSLTSALTYLGAKHAVTSEPAALASATHVILPGVGAFDAAMNIINQFSFAEPLQRFVVEKGMPLIGVCLGMQLLCESSEEGCLPGLALMPGHFRRLIRNPVLGHKVPHVGFSTVYGYQETGLFSGIGEKSHFYFTHSYALPNSGQDWNTGICDHAEPFVAAFQKKNICGVQFHPEKSQSAGLRLLSNFLELA